MPNPTNNKPESNDVHRAGDTDGKMIDRVIIDVLQRLPSKYLHLPTHAVGIRSRVGRIEKLLCSGSGDVQNTGIWGMAGIGKRILAKATFNEFLHRFEGKSFLENFGDHFKKPKGKFHLQKKLLSDIPRRDDIDKVLNNMDHAVKKRFRSKRVLVVIDDVEDMVQLQSVGIDLGCFGPGSRIIITTRNKHLLEQLDVENIYSPKKLNLDESLEFVSWHAFKLWRTALGCGSLGCFSLLEKLFGGEKHVGIVENNT